jgi:hypothetical protein
MSPLCNSLKLPFRERCRLIHSDEMRGRRGDKEGVCRFSNIQQQNSTYSRPVAALATSLESSD